MLIAIENAELVMRAFVKVSMNLELSWARLNRYVINRYTKKNSMNFKTIFVGSDSQYTGFNWIPRFRKTLYKIVLSVLQESPKAFR